MYRFLLLTCLLSVIQAAALNFSDVSVKGQLADIRYQITTTNDSMDFDLKQKIWMALHIHNDQTVWATIVRLDNLLDKETENLNYELYSHDSLWRNCTGWPDSLNITITSRGINKTHSIIIPPNCLSDCTQLQLHIPVEPVELDNPTEIPRLVIQVLGNDPEKIPLVISKTSRILQIMAPNWQFRQFFTNQLAEFIETYEPSSKALQSFHQIQPIAYKTDLFRYIALYHLGGVYADSKIVINIPLDQMIPTSGSFLTINNSPRFIVNSWMGLKPHSSLMRHAIDQIIANVENRYYGSTPGHPTGCRLLQSIFNDLPDQNQYHQLFHPVNSTFFQIENEPAVVFHNAEYRRRFLARDSCYYAIQYRNRTIYSEQLCE